MKIAYNWLRNFLDTDKTPEEISILLTACGLEVEHLEPWQSLKGGLEGIVIGEVLTCERHPNADRLSVTTVDVGDGTPKHIVCGAPNVAAGQKVVVALPGAKLYPSEGEPFEIKKSKIRGEASEGMICAEDEIGLSKSHAGIMILPAELKPGMPAADYFGVANDFIFEIGLTPNRADAASHLGVARDLKALLKIADLKFPAIAEAGAGVPSVQVEVQDAAACPRYSGMSISGINVAESPNWLKNALKSIGLRPINSIVDVTNYVMHELGQPLHAFDAAKITDRKILVRTLPAGTKFKTLDEAERELNGAELMISDSKGGLCIAGVFGGIDSGVSDATTEIFLESACFNAVLVRKAARAHGLHTDSSFRFERGTDPEMTVRALLRAAQLIKELNPSAQLSAVADFYPTPIRWNNIDLDLDYVAMLAGENMQESTVRSILTDLGCTVGALNGRTLPVSVPPFKVDVTRQADLVEELLRIYGYNAIELPKKLHISVAALPKPDAEEIVHRAGEWLVANGYREMLNNSLTRRSHLELIPMEEGTQEVEVLNPLSNDLAILRQTLLLPGLESIAYNINRKQKDLRLFEYGQVYSQSEGKYKETQQMGIWITGDRHEEHWKGKSAAYDIYYLKSVLQQLFITCGVDVRSLTLNETQHAGLTAAISMNKGKKVLAAVGSVKKSVLKAMDIAQPVFYAEINLNVLMSMVPVKDVKATEPPKFPEVRRDLSMVLNRDVQYAAIEAIAFKTAPKILRNVNVFDVYEGEKIGEGKKSYALSFTLFDEEATLQDKQIDATMEKIMKQLEEQLGAQIRRS